MIKILFLAKYRECIGFPVLDMEIAAPCLVDTVIAVLIRDYGDRAGFLTDQKMLISVNQELATAKTVIKDGDELAFFPPVTGG